MPPHSSDGVSEEAESIPRGKRRRTRQEVNPGDILPENASRSRKGTEKQRRIDEEIDAAKNKKIEQLKRELAKYKSAAKSKPTARRVIASDDDENETNGADLWDADWDQPESEDEDDAGFQTPFHSKGVVASAPKKTLKRLSQRSVSPGPLEIPLSASRASSQSRASIPPPSSPSGPSSRSSSRFSQQGRSQSPSSRIVHESKRNRASRYDREIESRSPSPPLADQLQKAASGTSKHTARRRGRSPSPKTHTEESTARKKQRMHSSDPQTDRSTYDIMPYAAGKVPAKGKPKDGDYTRPVRNLIKLAVKKYLLHIYTENAFPDEETAAVWASTSWSKVCEDAGKTFSPKDNERVYTLLMNRASSARGHLRDELKPLVISHFRLKSETLKSEVRNENAKIIKNLMEGEPPRFCYKDADGATGLRGYAELRFPLQALHTQLFRDRDHIGNEEPNAFNPLPLATLALVLTIVEFCLDEWADGRYNNSLKMDDKHYRPKYESHLAQLQHYHTLNPPVFTKIRRGMFERICRMMKTPLSVSEASRRVISDEAQKRAKAELDNCTGDTDSDAEGA